MDTAESLPDVPDMVDAGLPLWAAFRLWSEMMSSQNRDATYWRRRITFWPHPPPSVQ